MGDSVKFAARLHRKKNFLKSQVLNFLSIGIFLSNNNSQPGKKKSDQVLFQSFGVHFIYVLL